MALDHWSLRVWEEALNALCGQVACYLDLHNLISPGMSSKGWGQNHILCYPKDRPKNGR